jgi:hypothetical protein
MSYLISLFILQLASIVHSPAPKFDNSPAPKYWIEFRGKGISRKHFKPGNPVFEETRASLSEKCLVRRSKAMREPEIECISLEDAPINNRYIDSLRALGIRVEQQSKWSNAVSARLSASQIKRISKLKFVRDIHPVGKAKLLSSEPIGKMKPSSFPGIPSSFPKHPLSLDSENFADSGCGYNPIIYHYGGSQGQLDRINVWPLHAMGFDGSGVLLGFLDDGMRWKTTSCLEHCNVISEYDYVLHDSIVSLQPGDGPGQDAHGTTTLGCAMGYLPDTLIGPAFNAAVMLAETENASSERNIEEDNYANALEDMEARGVEITSSSLGYFTFDSGQHSYTYADMNGHTAICTQAVERAAKLGVLVVTAEGNQPDEPTVCAPADADSILACGALNPDGSVASFSSPGPTSDGRIKPDIAAPGVAIWVQDTGGSFAYANGTSYATPLTSGSCCLIKQAHPEATAQEIRHAVMVTGANAANPDNNQGWGEINAYAAALELGTIVHPIQIWVDTSVHICAGVASKNPIEKVVFTYFGDIDNTPHSILFNLVADSLIYSATLGSVYHWAEIGDTMYYVIRADDSSGISTYSPSSGWDTIALPQAASVSKSPNSLSQISVYPNPCSSQFDLTCDESGVWQLLDAIGNKIMSGSVLGPSEEHITTAQLANGAYFIRFVASTGETKVLPIVIAH